MRTVLGFMIIAAALMCLMPAALPAADEKPAEKPADEAAKPAQPAEKPTEAVNGLLAEVTVLNAPLYPGDDLALDLRLTNAQKEGDIQIVDYRQEQICFTPEVFAPDGQKIKFTTWLQQGKVASPKAPSALAARRILRAEDYARRFGLQEAGQVHSQFHVLAL